MGATAARVVGCKDPDEAILTKIAVIVRGIAIRDKVVRVDRSEQGIVDSAGDHLLETGFDPVGTELEAVRIHMAVGARPAVAVEPGQHAVMEKGLAEGDRSDVKRAVARRRAGKRANTTGAQKSRR